MGLPRGPSSRRRFGLSLNLWFWRWLSLSECKIASPLEYIPNPNVKMYHSSQTAACTVVMVMVTMMDVYSMS